MANTAKKIKQNFDKKKFGLATVSDLKGMLNDANLSGEEKFLSKKISFKPDEMETLVDFLSKVLSSNKGENEEAVEQMEAMEELGFKEIFLKSKSKIQALRELLIDARILDAKTRQFTNPFADIANADPDEDEDEDKGSGSGSGSSKFSDDLKTMKGVYDRFSLVLGNATQNINAIKSTDEGYDTAQKVKQVLDGPGNKFVNALFSMLKKGQSKEAVKSKAAEALKLLKDNHEKIIEAAKLAEEEASENVFGIELKDVKDCLKSLSGMSTSK